MSDRRELSLRVNQLVVGGVAQHNQHLLVLLLLPPFRHCSSHASPPPALHPSATRTCGASWLAAPCCPRHRCPPCSRHHSRHRSHRHLSWHPPSWPTASCRAGPAPAQPASAPPGSSGAPMQPAATEQRSGWSGCSHTHKRHFYKLSQLQHRKGSSGALMQPAGTRQRSGGVVNPI